MAKLMVVFPAPDKPSAEMRWDICKHGGRFNEVLLSSKTVEIYQ